MLDGIPEPAVRVLVADDTRLHTTLLADAMRRNGAFEVIGSDSQELITRPNLNNIDVLLLSSELDGLVGRGFEFLRKLRDQHPRTSLAEKSVEHRQANLIEQRSPNELE